MVSGVHFRGAFTCYVCCCWVGKGWNIGTLGDTLSGRDTLSGCVTQDLRVGSSEGCGIHPTHPVGVVVCTSDP